MSLQSCLTTETDARGVSPPQPTFALLIAHLVEGAALFGGSGSLMEMNDAPFDMLEQEPERARLERGLLRAFELVSWRQLTRTNRRSGVPTANALHTTELRTCAS